MTAEKLIGILQGYEPKAEIKIAHRPIILFEPMAAAIQQPVAINGDDGQVIYLSSPEEGYTDISRDTADALGFEYEEGKEGGQQ